MLEIVLIIYLCNRMGENMRAKGYEKPFWFQFFVPVSWLGGEFAGAITYLLIRTLKGEHPSGLDLNMYLSAVVGAGLATGALFLIARHFFPRPQVPPPVPRR